MQKREVLADGRIEMEWEVTAHRVEVRVVVAPAPAAPRVSKLPWQVPDPILNWAQWSLRADIRRMIAASLRVIPHDIGEHIATDSDSGDVEVYRNTGALLDLLENGSRDEFGTLLRAPDVIDGIVEIVGGNDRADRVRLQQVLRRHTAARRGAPRKSADERVDVATARVVAECELAIAKPFEFVKSLDSRQRRSARSVLIRKFGLDPLIADILARSRSRRQAAYRLIGEQQSREPESVKRAAARGVKHPDFIPPE